MALLQLRRDLRRLKSAWGKIWGVEGAHGVGTGVWAAVGQGAMLSRARLHGNVALRGRGVISAKQRR